MAQESIHISQTVDDYMREKEVSLLLQNLSSLHVEECCIAPFWHTGLGQNMPALLLFAKPAETISMWSEQQTVHALHTDIRHNQFAHMEPAVLLAKCQCEMRACVLPALCTDTCVSCCMLYLHAELDSLIE